MENQAPQIPELKPAEARTATLPGEAPRTGDYQALVRLLRKRLEKYISLMAEVLAGDDPEAVHDVRVWSRRLQQSLVALFPKPRPGKVRRLRRTLRRVRRTVGDWRNCDVALKLVSKEQRRTRSQAKRRAWELVRGSLLRQRSNQVARARKKLQRQDLADFAGRMEKLIARPGSDENTEALMMRLRSGIEAAWTKWQSSLVQAMNTPEAGDIHSLRIATKVLRYRIELLHHLGDANTEPLLDWLKALQEALGIWHDRQVLYQAMAEALARPEFLLQEPDAVRILLTEMAKDRLREDPLTDETLRLAAEHPGRKQMETWAGK